MLRVGQKKKNETIKDGEVCRHRNKKRKGKVRTSRRVSLFFLPAFSCSSAHLLHPLFFPMRHLCPARFSLSASLPLSLSLLPPSLPFTPLLSRRFAPPQYSGVRMCVPNEMCSSSWWDPPPLGFFLFSQLPLALLLFVFRFVRSFRLNVSCIHIDRSIQNTC